MNAFKTLLTAGLLALAANQAAADEKHGNWIADFDVAVELAKKENKDLFVDFTGSDWCGWCIKLHEEVFDHEAFLKPAMEKYILVALDFPNAEEIKAKVPNPKRNDELQRKYKVEGFPTILLMTPSGEVFGRTGYQPGGPKAYVKHIQELASLGKPAILESKRLLAAVEAANDATRPAAMQAVIAKVQELGPDSPPAASLIPVVKRAIELDKTGELGLKYPGIYALLSIAAADEVHLEAARAHDPKNQKGFLELVVGVQFRSVRDDTSARAAVAALKALNTVHSKQDVAMLYATAARWFAGPLQDKAEAKTCAQKAIDLGVTDENMLRGLNSILKS